MRLIDVDKLLRDIEKYHVSDGKFQHWVQIQPTVKPDLKETSSIHKALDSISRQNGREKENQMIDILKFIADHSGMNLADALKEAYEQGKRDVQSERKTGKWIMKYKGSAVTSYKCSECGRTVKDDTGYDVSKDYPFCHCGADMRRREQDDSI